MKVNLKKYLLSDFAKRLYLVLAIFLGLFVVCNDFIMPWYVNEGGGVIVPSVVGMGFDEGKAMLDSLGLEGRKGDVRLDREHPAGIVIIQNPIAGARVKKGRRVYLTVSGGEIMVPVPNVKGKSLRDARFSLEREGLKIGGIEYQTSDDFPAGTVMEQNIPPASMVKRETYVSVTVSQGSLAMKVAAPDLVGKTLTEAEALLTKIGLKPGNITYVPSADLLPNTVVDQYPRAGELVETGKAVDLIVVQGGEKRKDIIEY
jgi:beta-lactam-binding protein with PASTA domain